MNMAIFVNMTSTNQSTNRRAISSFDSFAIVASRKLAINGSGGICIVTEICSQQASRAEVRARRECPESCFEASHDIASASNHRRLIDFE